MIPPDFGVTLNDFLKTINKLMNFEAQLEKTAAAICFSWDDHFEERENLEVQLSGEAA